MMYPHSQRIFLLSPSFKIEIMRIIFLGFILLFGLTANGQTYLRNYDIETNDNIVGGVTATKTSDGDYSEYNVTTKVSMTAVFEINLEYKVQAIYQNKVLVSSSSTIYLNNEVQSTVTCERTGDHYTIVKDGHSTKIYDAISWSSAKMFFNKPKDVRKVFSETEGIMKNLSSTADGKFILRDPNNTDNTNTYTFSSEQGLHAILFKRELLPELTITGVRELKIDIPKENPEEK